MKPHAGIRWQFLAFAILVFLFNGYFTFAIFHSYRLQMWAHETFQPVQATVLESKVQRVSGDKGSDSFRPYVRYAYEVAGTRYESDRFFFQGIGYNEYAEARNVVARYPVGAVVTVYCDPESPEVAVVDNAPPAGMPFLLAGMGVFWGADAAILLYALWPLLKGRNLPAAVSR